MDNFSDLPGCGGWCVISADFCKSESEDMDKDDKSDLWIGAFRYYCGRQTIAVHSFTESLIKHWEEIPEGAQTVIRRDLDEAFADDRRDRERNSKYGYRLGHDCDRLAWKKLRKHIND